jgi:sugar phosphate permease
MALLAYLPRLGFGVLGPEIKQDFGLNDQDMGYLMSAFLISYGACQIPAGLAGDRLGARLLLPLFVLGWSLAAAAISLVPTGAPDEWLPLAPLLEPLTVLLVLRVLFGIFQSGAFPVFARVVADWMPLGERASAQGTLWTSSRLGGALIPFLFVWLLALCGGWRLPYGILAGLGVLWSLAFWSWFRDKPEQMPRVNVAERELIQAGRAGDGPDRAGPWRPMLRSRSVWCLCLMYGCCGPAGNFYFTMLPVYLRDHRHLSPETTQWLLGLPLAGGFFACVLGGLLSDRLSRSWGSRKWGRRFNGILGLTLAGLAFAATACVENVWLLGLMLCLAQLGNDFCMGPTWAACADIGGRYAGTVSGLMNMTGNCTGAVGAALAGYFFAEGQAGWVFVLFGATWVAGALCWLGIDVTRPLTAG